MSESFISISFPLLRAFPLILLNPHVPALGHGANHLRPVRKMPPQDHEVDRVIHRHPDSVFSPVTSLNRAANSSLDIPAIYAACSPSWDSEPSAIVFIGKIYKFLLILYHI
jgi:hypothetical protein